MIQQETVEKLYEIFCASGGVQTDSRKVQQGEMFFALKGENFDGNRYASSALEMGAVVAVVDEPQVAVDERYVLVEDVLEALQHLAHLHRKKLAPTVLAITGTNGKTTTKELVAAVLSRKFRICYTQGNLNNHIGVPLTLLSIPRESEFAIVEMGASARGEIALLASIAAPDFGLVTNIGRAHLEGFGGAEGIRKGKGELYDFLAASGGLALYRNDDEVLCEMVAERENLRAEGYSSTVAEGFRSNLVGDYNRFNIAAAVAVGRHFGVEESDIRAAIAEYVPSNNRSQSKLTERNLLTVDCYNANPSSMAAAIENHLAASHTDYDHKMLILGDMLELGEWSHEEHCKVLRKALGGAGVRVVVVGRNFCRAAEECGPDVLSFESVEGVREWLQAERLTGAFVLIKGSRGVGLEKILDLL